jgi:hypothetical protein
MLRQTRLGKMGKNAGDRREGGDRVTELINTIII